MKQNTSLQKSLVERNSLISDHFVNEHMRILSSSVGNDNFNDKINDKKERFSKKRIDFLLRTLDERNRVRDGSQKDLNRI